MAKVKITGHASGSGVFTITAPNSNTDRTITLPDASVTLGTDATKLPLAGGALTGALTTNSTIDGRDVAADGVLATNALPKSGGTMTGGVTFNAAQTLGSSSYWIAGNTTNAYTFNSVGDAANLFIIKNDGRANSEFTAKQWIQLNGTGTIAIQDSHNVSSIGDSGTGRYQINFTNNMANTNYSVSGLHNQNSGYQGAMQLYDVATTSYKVLCCAGSGAADPSVVTTVLFGG